MYKFNPIEARKKLFAAYGEEWKEEYETWEHFRNRCYEIIKEDKYEIYKQAKIIFNDDAKCVPAREFTKSSWYQYFVDPKSCGLVVVTHLLTEYSISENGLRIAAAKLILGACHMSPVFLYTNRELNPLNEAYKKLGFEVFTRTYNQQHQHWCEQMMAVYDFAGNEHQQKDKGKKEYPRCSTGFYFELTRKTDYIANNKEAYFDGDVVKKQPVPSVRKPR